jgi:hypothetical protein
MRLPSTSFTVAISLPPPTSLTACCTSAPAADRPRHALAMTMGVQTHLLPLDTEPNVVGLVHGGRDSQECPVQLLRSGEILDLIDDRSETLTLEELLALTTARLTTIARSSVITMTELLSVAQAAHSPATCLVAALRRFQTLICAIWRIKAARAGSS